MRGRRDELSTEYYQFAISVLKRYFDIPDEPREGDFRRISRYYEDFKSDLEDIVQFKKDLDTKLTANSAKHQTFNEKIARTHPLVVGLMGRIAVKGQRPLNNDKDLMMVLSALAFLTRPGMPANIHNYMVNRLKDGKALELAKELEEIQFVGDKLSFFILRDVILMNPELATKNASLAFPVDTWVLKVARSFGRKSEDHDEVRDFFINRIGQRSAV
jgi:hypothetical protein